MTRVVTVISWVALALAVLLSGCLCGVLRMSLEGERALVRSDEEFNRGRLRESLLFARRAAALYAPGLSHVRRADARLDAIAVGAESSQKREIAILSWQAIRATEQQRQWGSERPSDRAKQAARRLTVLLADDGGHGSLGEEQQFSRRVQDALELRAGVQPLRNFGIFLALGAMTAAMMVVHFSLNAPSLPRRWVWPATGLFVTGAVAWASLLLLA